MSAVKGAVKSKTMWFNILSAGLVLVDHLSTGTHVISSNIAVPVIAIGNILLRLLTTESLSEKGSPRRY